MSNKFENGSLIGQIKSTDSDYPNIHFEPGIHPIWLTWAFQQEDLERGYINGRPQYLWNGQVAERIKRYSPQILAIDSLSPSMSFHYTQEYPYSRANNLFIWGSLPQSPSEINKDANEIYVVMGDFVNYVSLLDKYLEATAKPELKGQLSKDIMSIQEKEERMSILKLGVDKELICVSLLFLHSRLKNNAKKDSNYNIEEASRRISRRDFFKAGVRGTLKSMAYLNLFNLVSVWPAAFSPNGDLKNFWEYLSSLPCPKLFNQDWLDARTALLIAKEQDVIDKLRLPKTTSGTVLLGASHTYEARTLMESSVARTKVIGRFMEAFLARLDKIINEKYPDLNKDKIRNEILDYITTAEVMKIRDPAKKGKVGRDLVIAITERDTINMYTRFQSPQVEEAIRHLRVA